MGNHHNPPPIHVAESSTGWRRTLQFLDARTPHDVQCAFERILMVPFTHTMDADGLRWNGTSHVNGAKYEFELRFLATGASGNVFSLHTVASWPMPDSPADDYFSKTSVSWFRLWTSELVVVDADAAGDRGSEYSRLCDAALRAERQLDSVAAVQRAIVEGVRRGGRFVSSHKEGGSNIGWRHGAFSRSDHGDDPGFVTYADEAAFLEAICLFHQSDVTRHAGGHALPELDAWKLILRRMIPT